MARESKAIITLEKNKIMIRSSCCGEILAQSPQNWDVDKGLLIDEGEAVCKGIMCKKKIRYPEVGAKQYELTEIAPVTPPTP